MSATDPEGETDVVKLSQYFGKMSDLPDYMKKSAIASSTPIA
jgi:hypothetical protein